MLAASSCSSTTFASYACCWAFQAALLAKPALPLLQALPLAVLQHHLHELLHKLMKQHCTAQHRTAPHRRQAAASIESRLPPAPPSSTHR